MSWAAGGINGDDAHTHTHTHTPTHTHTTQAHTHTHTHTYERTHTAWKFILTCARALGTAYICAQVNFLKSQLGTRFSVEVSFRSFP